MTRRILNGANLTGPLQLAGSAGTSGQVLQSAGPGSTPAWASAPAAGAGGSTTQVQYNNAGALAGATDVTIHDNDLVLLNSASVTTPPSGSKLFSQTLAGRPIPSFKDNSTSIASAIQPSLSQKRIAIAQGCLGTNTVSTWGLAGSSTPIATGTATAAAAATTNRHTRSQRVEYLVTTATTSAVAGFRVNVTTYSIGGSASDEGGFFFVCRWGPATGVSTSTTRAFVGMTGSTAAPTDVDPSSINNMIGMGWDSADTNIQMMCRGIGSVSKIDLGSSFPKPTVDRTKVYELAMFSPPGTTQSVSYTVTELGTSNVASGTITSNLPTAATLLNPRGYMSVGGTSSVIGMALMNFYIETDY